MKGLNKFWLPCEDKILELLREDTDLNLSIRDISLGMFKRSRSSVGGRLLILRRNHKVL